MPDYRNPDGSTILLEDYLSVDSVVNYIVLGDYDKSVERTMKKYSKYVDDYELDEELIFTSSLMYENFKLFGNNEKLHDQFLTWNQVTEYSEFLDDLNDRYHIAVDSETTSIDRDSQNSLTTEKKIASIVRFIKSKPFQSVIMKASHGIELKPQTCLNHISPRYTGDIMSMYSIQEIPEVLYELIVYYKQVQEILTGTEIKDFNEYCYSMVEKLYKLCDKSIIDDVGYYYRDFLLFTEIINEIFCSTCDNESIEQYIGFLLSYKNVKFITDVYVNFNITLYPERYCEQDRDKLTRKCIKFIYLILSEVYTTKEDTGLVVFVGACNDTAHSNLFSAADKCCKDLKDSFVNMELVNDVLHSCDECGTHLTSEQLETIKQVRYSMGKILRTYERSDKQTNILSLFDDSIVGMLLSSPFYDTNGFDSLITDFITTDYLNIHTTENQPNDDTSDGTVKALHF